MSDTVTEITSSVIQTEQQPPVKPKSTRGGWRPGGGRPKKIRPEKAPMTGSSLPALPPTQGGVTPPQKFFTFWHGLTETQLAQNIVYVNRNFPLCDAKVRNPDAPKYIDKLVGPCPCAPTEWREWFLKTYGSGDYRIYFNEGSAQRLRVEVTGLRDYENYPPKIDWETLMVNDPANRDFLRWARTHGYAEEIRRLEGGATPEAIKGKEDEEMNAAIVQQNSELTGRLVDMAERVAEARQPQPQAPRESLPERKALDMLDKAGDASFRMMEKAFDMQVNRVNENSDPLAHTRAFIDMAKTLNPSDGNSTIVELMRDQIAAQREEMRELRARLDTNVTAVQAPPQTMTDKLQEMVTLKNLLRELSSDDGEEKEVALKPGTPKAMFMDMLTKSGPAIVQATPGILQSVFYGISLLTRKAGDAPPPPPVAPPPPAINPQHKQEEDRVLFFMRMIEGSIKKHLNEWEQRDYPGADFADWLIDSQLDGRNAYDQLKAAGPDILTAQLQTYPPINEIITGMPDKFRTFVQQFLDRDAIRKQEEADEDTDGATT